MTAASDGSATPQETQATWTCLRLSGCRMLSRRWRLLAPLSSMSTSHRGDHFCTHQLHHCLHCLACCSRFASAKALTPQRKDLHIGRGLCTLQWFIVSPLCSISTIEKASLLRHTRQWAVSLLRFLATAMTTRLPSLWVPIQGANSVSWPLKISGGWCGYHAEMCKTVQDKVLWGAPWRAGHCCHTVQG